MSCDALNRQQDVAISAKPTLATGINRAVYPILQCLNADEIVFAIEKLIIVQNVHTTEHEILQPLRVIQSRFGRNIPAISLIYITSIAVCVRLQYFSVHLAALNAQKAYVMIYKAHGKKKNQEKVSLSSSQQKTRPVVQNVFSYESNDQHSNIDFSCDGQLVCCASARALNVYDWKAGRKIACLSMRYDVKRLLFNPFDMAQILSQSQDNQKLQLWVMEAYQLRLKATFNSNNERGTSSRNNKGSRVCEFLDYVWLFDDVLVMLLTRGIVQLMVEDKMEQELNLEAIAASLKASSQIPPESKFYCLALHNDSDNITVGADQGFLILKYVQPVRGLRELQVLRYLHLQTAKAVIYIVAMPKSALTICFTSSHYGVCDISAVSQFNNEKRSISFNPLCSSLLTQLGNISIAIRQPYLAFVCEAGKNDYFLSIWSMEHNGRIIVNHTLDNKTALQLMTPRGRYVDIHPLGLEVLVGVNCKIDIYLIVNDGLRLYFEANITDSDVGSSSISQVAYNPSGSLFLCALTLHSEPCGIYVYRNYQRTDCKPHIVTFIDTSKGRISQSLWHPNDTSFVFIGDCGAKLSCVHLALSSDTIDTASHGMGLSETYPKSLPIKVAIETTEDSNEFFAIALGIADEVSRGAGLEQPIYALFVLEKLIISGSSAATQSTESIRQTMIRAWIHADLYNEVSFDFATDGLATQQGEKGQSIGQRDTEELGLILPYSLTALESGSHQSLYAGTSHGVILILQWNLTRTGKPICSDVFKRPSMRVTLSHRIDLHTVPIMSLIFVERLEGPQLISSNAAGVIIICNIRTTHPLQGTGDTTHVKETCYKNISFRAKQEVVELGLYDRNLIVKERLTYEELEVHLHQFQLESERLNQELDEQKASFQNILDQEKRAHDEKTALQEDHWRVQVHDAVVKTKDNNDALIHDLSVKAKNDRIQYRSSISEYQSEILLYRNDLEKAESRRHDQEMTATIRLEQLKKNYDKQLAQETTKFELEKVKLAQDLTNAQQSLKEALEQIDQDHLRHLSLLSGSIETTKKEAQKAVTSVQGQVAGLNQELKLLLQALTQKDEEINQVQSKTSVYHDKIKRLKASLKQQEQETARLRRSNSTLEVIANEQKEALHQLKRLNTVHQSQAQMLQSQLIPKENETQAVKQHMTQLHAAHQEMSLLAQFNDRLCFVQKAKIKKYENNSRVTQRRIERLQVFGRSIMEEIEQLLLQPVVRGSNHTRNKGSPQEVGQDERFGELTSKQRIQSKESTLRHNLQLLHRRWTKKWEFLTASVVNNANETAKQREQQKCETEVKVRDESIQSEIERQNESLLRNKMQLHHQLQLLRKEKSQLSTTLTFQNTTLMTELNDAKKRSKILEQKLEEYHSRERNRSRESKLVMENESHGGSVTSLSPELEHTEQEGCFKEEWHQGSSFNGARMIRILHHSASMPSKLECAPNDINQRVKSQVITVVSPDFDGRTVLKAAEINPVMKFQDSAHWKTNPIGNSERIPLTKALKASGRSAARPVTATKQALPNNTLRPQSAMDRK
uniref:Uncharacterized protein AlNc14C203G8738 n=1 Tax=Albugo laibachii Nc14 TaxID=890382 RepID=F0W7V9_9STRA|nr:conserved hypothetical protein [Albugo laibachii Nc14]CCA23687.1 conserved hypothetical protein [Albugo laibachii Nc14]|eukprot:CCA23687.1 conserved hypothetical protein [Albugo laibachii Nc14]